MYYLASVCCTCLKKADSLINLSDPDSDEVQFIQQCDLWSFIFTLKHMELHQPLFMCQSCCKYLKIASKFVQRCRRNCAILRSYVDQLKSVSEELPNRYFDVSVEISTRDSKKCALVASQQAGADRNTSGDTSILASKNTNFTVAGSSGSVKTRADAIPFVADPFSPAVDKENAAGTELAEAGSLEPTEMYDGVITNFAFETFVEMQQNADQSVADGGFGMGFVKIEQGAVRVAQKRGTGGARCRGQRARRATNRWVGRTMYCRDCGKPVKEYNFKRHLLTHADVKPFKCQACGVYFTRIDHLQTHNRRHHHADDAPNWSMEATWWRREECHMCPKCLTLFATPKLLRLHLTSHYQRR